MSSNSANRFPDIDLSYQIQTKFPNSKKRVIFTSSEKGGCGKTTMSIWKLQWLLDHGFAAVGGNPDPSNYLFPKVMGDERVGYLDLEDEKNVDQLDEMLGSWLTTNDVIVVDGKPAARDSLTGWMEDIGLLDEDFLNHYNLGITFTILIEEDGDMVRHNMDIIESHGDKVDWMVFENRKQGSNPRAWKAAGGLEIEEQIGAGRLVLPKFHPHLLDKFIEWEISVPEARRDKRVTMPDQNRCKNFTAGMYKQLCAMSPLLVPGEVGKVEYNKFDLGYPDSKAAEAA